MADYNLRLRATYAVDAYHLVDEPHRMGWAIAYVDDRTGTLSLVTDWGEFGYRWGTDSFGDTIPTLTEFLGGRTRSHYVISKLLSEERREAFDAEATVASLRERIVERRRECGLDPPFEIMALRRWLDPATARELWNELEELRHAHDWRELYEGLSQDFHDHFEVDFESARTEPSREARALDELILPALWKAITAECERRRAGAGAVGAMIAALGAAAPTWTGKRNDHPDGCHTTNPKAARTCASDGHYACGSCAARVVP